VNEVWNDGFIDAPSMPDEVQEGLLDNLHLSDKLAKLHDLLVPWALDQQHPSAQRMCKSFTLIKEHIFLIVLC